MACENHGLLGIGQDFLSMQSDFLAWGFTFNVTFQSMSNEPLLSPPVDMDLDLDPFAVGAGGLLALKCFCSWRNWYL